MSVLTPFLFYGIYAITKYQLRTRTAPTLLLSTMAVVGLGKLGVYSSDKEINRLNKGLYDKYKDEVVLPKYRGLKLYSGKKAYQIDNKEFTSSNFDDLKELVLK